MREKRAEGVIRLTGRPRTGRGIGRSVPERVPGWNVARRIGVTDRVFNLAFRERIASENIFFGKKKYFITIA
jgi:hypothetical protein